MIQHDHFSATRKQMDIQTRVCPRGHVYLYVGHTCLFLRQDEFFDVAQVVHAVENHLLAEEESLPQELSH